jgi:hypothetical protein
MDVVAEARGAEDRGYVTLRPRRSAPVAVVAIGSNHRLRAVLQDSMLTVWAPGKARFLLISSISMAQ